MFRRPRFSRLRLICAALAAVAMLSGAAQAQEAAPNGLVQQLQDANTLITNLQNELKATRDSIPVLRQDLVRQLQEANAKIAALQQNLRTYQNQEVERMAHLACGTINANTFINRRLERAWDFGRAFKMTSPAACDQFCKGKEGNQCGGALVINRNKMHMTGYGCAHTVPEHFPPQSNGYDVFCCCR